MSKGAADPRAWIGRRETVDDGMPVEPALAAAAMLDDDATPVAPGAPLPPLWHWFHFVPRAPQRALAADGHPARDDDGFLPPIPYPRRMFAGARVRVRRPLVLGRPARRDGEIRDVALKDGRSGPLGFVTVAYRYVQDGATCVEEEQDIVYREPGAPVPAPVLAPPAAPPLNAWERTVTPDPRLLFRFSALTFNAHRIHYDRDYAAHTEGYPGLVVHGPLTALLLCELARAHAGRRIASFTFRGEAPLFDLAPFRLVGIPAGDEVALQAIAPDGRVALRATATLE